MKNSLFLIVTLLYAFGLMLFAQDPKLKLSAAKLSEIDALRIQNVLLQERNLRLEICSAAKIQFSRCRIDLERRLIMEASEGSMPVVPSTELAPIPPRPQESKPAPATGSQPK